MALTVQNMLHVSWDHGMLLLLNCMQSSRGFDSYKKDRFNNLFNSWGISPVSPLCDTSLVQTTRWEKKYCSGNSGPHQKLKNCTLNSACKDTNWVHLESLGQVHTHNILKLAEFPQKAGIAPWKPFDDKFKTWSWLKRVTSNDKFPPNCFLDKFLCRFRYTVI